MNEDFHLLERWRAGDDRAGSLLLRRHFTSVYRFFRTKLADGVDDLTQQTFLCLAEARDRIERTRSFRAYLFTIARRQLVDALRERHRRWTELDPDCVSAVEAFPADSRHEPNRALARSEEQRLLLTAMRSIPLDPQIALELHYWEGLSVAEIAEVLGTSPGTIKSRLKRARDLLQSKIDKIASHRSLVRRAGGQVDELVSSLGDTLLQALAKVDRSRAT